MAKRCEFDSGNADHVCEISGNPCPVEGKKDKCPILNKEKEEETEEPFTEKHHSQH